MTTLTATESNPPSPAIGIEAVTEVPTITALKALSTPATQIAVNCLGYYSAGDGGGGTYYWSAASTATDDSATIGSIIQLNSGGTGRFILISGNGINTLTTGGATGSALASFTPSGTGAVARTVQSKLRDIEGTGDFALVDDYGAGNTNNTTKLQSLLDSGKTHLLLSTPANGFVLAGEVAVPQNVRLMGASRRFATNCFRVLNTYTATDPVFVLRDGNVLEHICVRGEDDERRGIAFAMDASLGTASEPRWSTLIGVTANHMKVGIQYANGAYYNEILSAALHNCTTAVEITGTASGALEFIGGHLANNTTAVHADIGNQIAFRGVTFEDNDTGIHNEGGVLLFDGCYIAESAQTQVITDSGRTIIDGRFGDTDESGIIANSGADSRYGGSPPAAGTATYGVRANGGTTVLRDVHLRYNIHGNIGIDTGTWENGADIHFNGGDVECWNVTAADYIPWSYSSGKPIRGEQINNYVINGVFADAEKAPYDQIPGTGVTITPHATKKNIWGGKMQTYSGTADGSSMTVRMRYQVPARLVGQVMYVGFITCEGTNQSNPRIQTGGNIDFDTVDSAESLTPGTLSAGVGWNIGSTGAFENHPRVHWLPGTIVNAEGYIEYQITNAAGGTGAYSFDCYGFFLTERDNFMKVANFRDGWMRRVGTTAPTRGTWDLGDIVWQSSPALTTVSHYVCTSAGAPGTWRSYGEPYISGSKTYDPGSLADGAGEQTTVTVTSAALGDFAEASFSLDLQGITMTAWVSAANTVTVRFQNESGGVLDLGSGTLRAKVRRTT